MPNEHAAVISMANWNGQRNRGSSRTYVPFKRRNQREDIYDDELSDDERTLLRHELAQRARVVTIGEAVEWLVLGL